MKKLFMTLMVAIGIFAPNLLLATDRLNFYQCKNMQACTEGCIYQNRKGVFLVDRKNSIVKMNIYEGGGIARSSLFDKCKAVFDSKNWDCSEQTEFNGGVIRHTRQMNDRIYYGSDFAFSMGSTNNLEVRKISESCAK